MSHHITSIISGVTYLLGHQNFDNKPNKFMQNIISNTTRLWNTVRYKPRY